MAQIFANRPKVLPTSASILVTENCNLACTYCLTEDAMITMKDMSKKSIKDIVIGDEILGFEEYASGEKGSHRKVLPAKVEQLFKRKDKVIKITLEDGSELKITKNHKILNNRGNSVYSWKEAGKYKVGQSIMTHPKVTHEIPNVEDDNYMIGYFIAMMMGDGNYGQYKDKLGYDAFRVRIAVKDDEIIERMEKYFTRLGFSCQDGDYEISKKDELKKRYLYSNKKESYFKLVELIDSNLGKNKSKEYFSGFIAGIYDAEGSIDKDGCIRIVNSDESILKELTDGLDLLGFDWKKEKKSSKINKQCYTIRILNGVRKLDYLNFIVAVNPAVYRKGLGSYYGKRTLTKKKIVSIEELDEVVDVYNIGTTTRTYIANDIAVHNCFEIHNTKVMTIETARKTLEFLCYNAVESGVGRFDAMIFGGEPLLNPDVVEEIFRYGVELSQKHNVTFTSNIITNCTVMNDRIKNMLIKWRDPANLTIQLSVDGKQEVQDRYRITKTGGGSFHLVEKNIPIFQEIFADDPRRLSIHGCVNRDTVGSLYESYHFFKYDWGFSNIWFLPVIEEKWRLEDVVTYDEQNKLIFEDILKTIKETGDISPVYEYAPMDRCMDRQVRPSAPCGAGKNFVTVTCNGEIYPCHQIYFHDPDKETLIGNVYTGIDEPARTMYIDYTQANLSCPSTCENVHCFRCLAVNWIENGNIFSQVRGYYCYLSSTDKKYQDMLRKEVEALGLMGMSSEAAGYRNSGEFAVDMDQYAGVNNVEDCCGDGAFECGCGDKQQEEMTIGDDLCGCNHPVNESQKEYQDDLDIILAESTCLCNARESTNVNLRGDGCDIVASRANAMPGNNPDNPDCLCDARSSIRPYSFEAASKTMEERYGQRLDVTANEMDEMRDILKDKKGGKEVVVEDQVVKKVDIDEIPEGADIIEEPVEEKPKKKRGRPRKVKTEEELAAEAAKPKRKRGRPRKVKPEEASETVAEETKKDIKEVKEAVEEVKEAVKVPETYGAVSSDIAKIMADDEPPANETLEERWARYMKEAEEKTFGKEQEVDEDVLAQYQDGQYRFITGEPVDNRLLIEVRIDKKKRIHMKYENILDKTVEVDVQKYEGELPVGYYEVLDYDFLAQYRQEMQQPQESHEEVAAPQDEFQEVVSLALTAILEKLIGIESRIDKIESSLGGVSDE